tara:strand:- start:308 stop:601 length:294 start_codon:yes stop_codon:yes gene_type:complete
MREEIKQALKKVHDPEISVDIYELGLIYSVIETDNHVDVDMTLTSPTCPVAGFLIQSVEKVLKEIEGIDTAYVNIVFQPAWNESMMSEEAKLEFGLI